MDNTLNYQHEVEVESVYRDGRTLGKKISDFLEVCDNMLIAVIGMIMLMVLLYPIIEWVFLLFLLLANYVKKVQDNASLPIVMPKSSGFLDPGDPGFDGKPKKADGIIYLGNEEKTNKEIWLTDTQMRTHMLTIGTTGSGKTEQLLGLVFNALIHDSGFIYVDGKADSKLYANIYQMARMFGREDDVLVINFQKGGKDIYGATPTKMSNTMNPFAFGSSGMLSQLLVGLMSTSSEGQSDVWENRAILFIEALMKPLVYLRDNYGIMIDAHTIRSFFEFSKIEELVVEYPKKYKGFEEYVTGLRSYLVNIPGYDIVKNYKNPSEESLEQHGYITMQLVRTMGSLADTYGYIMRTPMPEIDMRDVFLNRRILVVLLPALENSPQELTNLGRIVVASLKATMAVGLGAELEGEYKRVIDAKPTTASMPFICVLDEYGYYAVKGFAVVPAQARSLGFAACFAGQDLPGFEKSGKEEAESTTGNTTTKLCGKLEDTRTFEFFSKVAGEGYFLKSGGIETFQGDLGMTKAAVKTDSYDKVNRLSIVELQRLNSGQWYIFRNGKIIRARSFYTDLQNKKVAGSLRDLRINHFVRVARMEKKEALEWKKARQKTIDFLLGKHPKRPQEDDGDSIVVRIGSDFEMMKESVNVSPVSPERLMLGLLMRACVSDDGANEMDVEYVKTNMPIHRRMNLLRENDGDHEDIRIAIDEITDSVQDFESDIDDDDIGDIGNEYRQKHEKYEAFSNDDEDDEDMGDIMNAFGVVNKGKQSDDKVVLDSDFTGKSIEAIEFLSGIDGDSAKQSARDHVSDIDRKTRYPLTRPPIEKAKEFFFKHVNLIVGGEEEGKND